MAGSFFSASGAWAFDVAACPRRRTDGGYNCIMSLLLIILAAVLLLVIFIVRLARRLHPSRPERANYDFAIEELLRLRQAGEISHEEFERAKAVVISRRPPEATDPTQAAFQVLQRSRPVIQPLEDRSSP
jgi:uncharacterized membrane protein